MSHSTSKVSVIKMYAARQEIYPREVKGRYANVRWICVWLTQWVFYGMPWLSWNERQAVLFDLGARKFYIFGIVLWPQDFVYLAALLIICAYALFLLTAIAGRVWCGFACPQTVYTEIFMWIERQIEGNRSQRMRLDRQPWSITKLSRKVAKHAAWGGVALWTGITFVGYFTPLSALSREIASLTLGPWEWFWILFYALATYGNAGWMREQVCKYMCPYARFQSSMFDQDTLIITYDSKRGEPRNMPSKKDNATTRLGACIDCSMCVQVCPTGIDIRQGLQYECIGCASCIDACNLVMDRIDQPRGLIRYSSEHAINDNLSLAQMRQRVLRPRVLIYASILAMIATVFIGSLIMRMPLKLDVIRDRGMMGREVENGSIENVYRLQIMNTAEVSHRYNIAVSGIDSIRLVAQDEISINGADSRTVPVRVRIDHDKGKPGSNKIVFTLKAQDDTRLQVREAGVFLVPK